MIAYELREEHHYPGALNPTPRLRGDVRRGRRRDAVQDCRGRRSLGEGGDGGDWKAKQPTNIQ